MTRISTFKWFLALVVGFVSFSSAQAKEGHAHEKGPHGGTVIGFGDDNHIEGVREGEKISFYVLGDDGQSSASIAKASGGTVTLISSGKGTKKIDLPKNKSFSEYSVDAPKGNVTALIKVKAESKTISAKFNFK